ncbi:MAG: hypothetical protein K9M81_03615 [Chthoniobacterales bacterium]|nr:hypothetical protein [Chthoniobacterales bacterium]
MKGVLLLLTSTILVVAIVVERGGLSWELERPLLHYLAKKTDHPLPCVTAVVLPMTGPVIASQDSALALRAIVSFHPRLILIAAPMDDLSSGLFSLLREARSEGAIQGMFCIFGSFPKQPAIYHGVDMYLFPMEPELTPVAGEVGSLNTSGFILPNNNKNEALSMPLFGITSHGEIVSSLWWRGLENIEKKESSLKPLFLLGKRMLILENKNVIWLGAQSCLLPKKAPPAKMISLDDLLLLREEMERGEIRPNLEMLFRNTTVILGGGESVAQAALLQDAQQQISLHHIGTTFYALLLVLLTFGVMIAVRFSEIDFWLFLFCFIVVYALAIFVLFYFLEILLPLVMPSSIVIIALLKREWGRSKILK